MQKLSLPQRFAVLIANAITAYVFHVWFTGGLGISGGLTSVWLITALSMWFLNLLSSPWFIPPKDAVPAAIAVIIALTTIDLSSAPAFHTALQIGRGVGIAYAIAVLAVASTAIISLASGYTTWWGTVATRLTAIFGPGELLFTPVVVISVLGGFQPNYAAVSTLLSLWVFLTIARPYERLLSLRDLMALETKSASGPQVGTVVRVDDPNIVRVQLISTTSWRSNQLHTVAMPDGTQHFVVALFSQTRGTEVVGTGLCVAPAQEKLPIAPRCVVSTHNEQKTAEFLEEISGVPGATLVGFVVENSSIGSIRFEVSGDTSIGQGVVVFVKIKGETVVYQIVDAETSEESFDQNPRGTHIVTASQLGVYSSANGFEKFAWLPTMNAAVFMSDGLGSEGTVIGEREFNLASIPGTKVAVAGKIDDLVDYHTAILGVTGTGKTELALSLVEEALKAGVKVFCVDFTGQYKARLAAHNPASPGPSHAEVGEIEQKIRAVDYGSYGAGAEKKALDTAIVALRATTQNQVSQFIEGSESLAVFELPGITNNRATLKITELYLSAIMDWAKANPQKQRVLIVLEEAHTIIPETGGAGFDFDTQWVVGRIGQIALQGRKLQVGLLVVSQRTALVSKTILSQCNTFFTHTLIDQTSLSFLDSVYSHQHSRLIPNLGRYEFIAYGKGIKAARPVILKRNIGGAD